MSNPVVMASGIQMIAEMLNLIGNGLLLPIVVLLATGTGIVMLVVATLDVTGKLASGGKCQKESQFMIAAKFIFGGALLVGGSLGGFNLITGMQSYVHDTAVGIAKGDVNGQPPWDGLDYVGKLTEVKTDAAGSTYYVTVTPATVATLPDVSNYVPSYTTAATVTMPAHTESPRTSIYSYSGGTIIVYLPPETTKTSESTESTKWTLATISAFETIPTSAMSGLGEPPMLTSSVSVMTRTEATRTLSPGITAAP
jgi:hypothetical protein